MPIYKGNTKIIKLYKGSIQIVKRYKGTDLIYSASRLPSAFQEVEYLESNGTQYIDSGVSVNENTGCILDLQFIMATGQAIGVLEPGVGRFAPCFVDSDYKLKCAINLSNTMIIYTDTNVYSRYLFEYNIDNRKIKFNGNDIGVVGTIGSTVNTIYLFCRNYTASRLYANIKLYSCELYDNGTLVRNFIPCYRKADNVAGLYDLVNGVFYTNAGTGTFIVGDNV